VWVTGGTVAGLMQDRLTDADRAESAEKPLAPPQQGPKGPALLVAANPHTAVRCAASVAYVA
jgi:hypothetical protein